MKAEKWAFLSVGEGEVALLAGNLISANSTDLMHTGMRRLKKMKEREAAEAILSNERSKLKKTHKPTRYGNVPAQVFEDVMLCNRTEDCHQIRRTKR
eukprot:767945-Hanusia_phi.AAC.9